jgi:hypothetical protein
MYATIALVAIFPIHQFALPPAENKAAKQPQLNYKETVSNESFHSKIFCLLLLNFTIGAVLTTGIDIHLIDILLDKKMVMTTVVGIVAFLGPNQADVQVFELLFSKNEPVKTAIISAVVTLLGEHLRLSWRRRKGILPIFECLPE